MKEKIIIFIVGLLIGSVLSTASIYIYTIAENQTNRNEFNIAMPNGNMDEKRDDTNNNPPEIPDKKNNNEGI